MQFLICELKVFLSFNYLLFLATLISAVSRLFKAWKCVGWTP